MYTNESQLSWGQIHVIIVIWNLVTKVMFSGQEAGGSWRSYFLFKQI